MKTIRVMIADDDADLRAALVDVLSGQPSLEVVGIAEEAQGAIELARTVQPDVALVDVRMPGGGGVLATREIHRFAPATRVVVLSARGDRSTVLEMLRAGAVGYLVKGAAPEAIVEAIEGAMDGRSSLSAEVVGDVVQELSTQLRREGDRAEELKSMRDRVGRVLGGHGLSIVFQPIVDLTDRSVVGFEALSRFEAAPRRPPDRWFADATSIGLGTELELHAIERALAHASQLPGGVYLSLNLSHRTVLSGLVLEALGSFPPALVVLEITEHERIEDYEALDAALEEIRAVHVRVAIDDAGAGFASLQHILRLAPDIIKLDISITRDVHRHRGGRAMAAALKSFGEEMGVSLVAEGVEAPEQVEALLELGVRFGQGYFLGRPTARPDAIGSGGRGGS